MKPRKATVKATFEARDLIDGSVVGTGVTFELLAVEDGRVVATELSIRWPDGVPVPAEGRGALVEVEHGRIISVRLAKEERQ